MAKKNGSTPKSNPGLPSEASEFISEVIEAFNSRPAEEQHSFLAKYAARKRELILLDFKPYDILDDLEGLRAMVESGEINGLIFAAKYTNPGEQRHFFGASGRYAENADEALGAAVMLQNKLAKVQA